ncbi:MAG: orotidine-5'-phosphate decarboxylase [Bacteroidota bacterium]
MKFTQKLQKIQRRNGSLLCVGLDVDPARLPSHLRSASNAALQFNRRIIEATSDLVCAYKLNLAFYEALGDQGWHAMRQTLSHIPKGVITIGNGKRSDIGNTSDRYATALYDDLGFDAVTVNPYMGYDSVEPFIRSESRCAFVLILTSNEGSRDFQRLTIGGRPFYEKVVHAAVKWNTKKNIGLVVGATHPEELQSIRRLALEMPILIPGIGKQGGDIESAVRYGCSKRGELAIINASRSIIYASNGKDFASAARKEATKLHNQILAYQEHYFG